MQLVSSPLVTASVALIGAGVVAVTPVAAPPPGLPDVQTRAVQLMSGSDPLTQWGTVLQTPGADATDIYDHFSAAPFADLQQSIANDVGYVEDLLKNPSDISRVLTDLQNNASALFGSSTDLDLSGVRSDQSRPWSSWTSPSPRRSAGAASVTRFPGWLTSDRARPTRAAWLPTSVRF
jgi:hypothetical protein